MDSLEHLRPLQILFLHRHIHPLRSPTSFHVKFVLIVQTLYVRMMKQDFQEIYDEY